MIEIKVTKSNCNRIFSITRNLKDKSFDDQVVYLTCHLLALSNDAAKQQLTKKYLRSKPDLKSDCLKNIKKTSEYELVLDFWTNESLGHFLAYKGAIISAKRRVSYADLEHRESTTTTVYFEQCFATLLVNLKLTA